MRSLDLVVSPASGLERFSVTARSLVIAGWTGRDVEEVEKHSAELERLGISRPSKVPVFYHLAADLLIQDDTIEVIGRDSSGEAEAVLLAFEGELWVGIGSDHTDRRLESVSVAASKQVCAKPLGREVWPLQRVIGHWDQLILRSYLWTGSSRTLYQKGYLGHNLNATELIDLYSEGSTLEDGTVMFCGTLPLAGDFTWGTRFDVELEDPVLEQRLCHSYQVCELPAWEESA